MKTNTLLLVAAAAVGVYLLTRPKVTALSYNPYGASGTPAYNPYYGSAAQPYGSNTVAQDIQAGSSALSSLSDLVGNFF
jgi:hypothetical protein